MIHTYEPGRPVLESHDISSLVLVGGCFDVLHYGHLKFLQQARALGNTLVVALESDAAIVQTKDRRVFHNQQQRAELLDSLDVVSDVLLLPILSSDVEYMDLVKAVNPDVIAFTEGDPYRDHKAKQAQVLQAKIAEIPYMEGFSTTDLLHKYCVY